jgi:hypothetical protein
MKTLLIVFGFSIISLFNQAQIISSNTYIRTCINKLECASISNSSLLFYDENKNSLYLKIDFNNFKTGQDSLDNWLDDLSETALYYKAPFPPENFLGLSNNQHKNFTLRGQTYMNGVWLDQTIELSLYSSENSITSASNIGNNFDNYKVNFSLSVVPKDFKLHKKPHHLTETIFIGIALGRINQLKPESRPLLGEAYNH